MRPGPAGLKLHEDWGTTPAAIDCCLAVADRFDVPVAIHTDTLNEAGFVEDTIAAIGGRAIHTYHTEGAGGGHAPDIIRIASELNVLPSSTNPTRPYTVNTLTEHMDMLMVCHHLSPRVPEDVAFAESRIRPETMAAEDVLHDLGVISMYASDSQAMGRVGENFTRLFQTADKMRQFKGKLPEDSSEHDNFRVLRYLAKLTINPAITHGISHLVGSLEPGKLADIVLWPVGSFGAKPKMIIKGGMICWAVMGDPNGSIPTAEPSFYRPMFGAMGRAVGGTSLTFVSQAAYDAGVHRDLGLTRRVEPVRGCRTITKRQMVRNDRMPVIEVDPRHLHGARRRRDRHGAAGGTPQPGATALPGLADTSHDGRRHRRELSRRLAARRLILSVRDVRTLPGSGRDGDAGLGHKRGRSGRIPA